MTRPLPAAALDSAGPYELLRLLGHGSYCAVYEARDRKSGERVALKQLRRVGPVSLAHFKREFRAVQGLHHPNLVELRELFEHEGHCFIAMELVEGSDLLSYVRLGPTGHGFHERKLREAFAQLAQALIALHAAGVVHRDVKPRNVLVTPRGRVVLLDFGLAHAADSGLDPRSPGLGSAAYMAPEQVEGRELGPSADLYALGVCLYEALTGTTPFADDEPHALMQRKQRERPRSPAELQRGVPAELAGLCLRLLEPDASLRSSAEQVIESLRSSAAAAAAEPPAPAAHSGGGFAGRDAELAALEQALQRTAAGQPSLVLVSGESGIGKSALVSEFLQRVRRGTPNALILRSRCYENELLAYTAFDGGMEQLSAWLSGQSSADCAALLPPAAALLPRLFASFGTVPAIGQADAGFLPAEPAAQRQTAFAALTSLLRSLARERPLLIAIDDLQWADAESFHLLRALLEAQAAPACLIVATLRPALELSDDSAAALAGLESFAGTRRIELEGMALPAAQQLAAALLGPRATPVQVDTLVSESRGHPLLLAELARYAGAHALPSGKALSLDDALRARMSALPATTQQLLAAVALAGRPYHSHVFASALGLAQAEVSELAGALLAEKLLRRRRGHELTCFHDRIRHVAEQRLTPEAARALHSQLAAALARQPASDPAELARHHAAAGERAAAAEACARAGDQALAALAFARAAQLFGSGLQLADEAGLGPALQARLRVGRGHALARGGRSAEAARDYLLAAQHASPEQRTQLRLWAAQHLLQSAHVDEGMQAARALLEELGVPLPSGSLATIARMLWDRSVVRARGLELGERTAPPSVDARMQLAALRGLIMPVSWLEPVASAALNARYLRLARAQHEPVHLAHALAEEAFALAVRSPDDAAAGDMLRRARTLAAASDDPTLDVSLSFREASVATFHWDLPRARERLEHAQRVGTARCPDQPWLLTNVRTALASALVNMGEHARASACCHAWISEAQERGDQFTTSMIETVGNGVIRHLMQDDLATARAATAAAVAPWSRERFAFVHFGELIAVSYTELYAGGEHAQRWFEAEGPRLGRAFLLKVGLGQAVWAMFSAFACLSAYLDADPAHRESLLQTVRARHALLQRMTVPLASMNALVLEAQLAALEGDRARALRAAREVREKSEACSYGLMARSVEYLEGLLLGGDAGHEKCAAALSFFAEQGWKNPQRASSMFCPVVQRLGGGT